ncbi:pimeloyl-ACP methyl ester carboxylesterase [Novosphingobium chloroacetimidivorans]|uniref:Pimeloyl-ACP methyl ester carboxylesterase n=1 Tax=Novosphingobium chloroacetimidivorans TaxID=1428314 RepID=A0A7W7NW36_9SPHN|nr:alpha/beta fold hydrolase [Novosphingobium chloroacetimidivorans]MBB4859133.1 pimeloyl-ACP methyl ester carboxylesterase [Novosphingobium chloroacetimidivorans]
MTDVRTDFLPGFGGARLAVHRMGEGRPVLLLHGLFSSAQVNWIKFGHAQKLVDAGFEAIMPDLRAHGQSEGPHDPAAYPADVLVRDALVLVEQLRLTDYDLGGFSLGSRTAVRSVLAGLAPRRLILGGMGIEGLGNWARRSAFFVDAIDRYDTIKHGDPAFVARSFMRTQKVDLVAARLLLQSVDDTPPEALAGVNMSTLVVCGVDDHDNGSAPALADALPNACYVEIPGTHMSSVTEKAMGDAMAAFLSE